MAWRILRVKDFKEDDRWQQQGKLVSKFCFVSLFTCCFICANEERRYGTRPGCEATSLQTRMSQRTCRGGSTLFVAAVKKKTQRDAKYDFYCNVSQITGLSNIFQCGLYNTKFARLSIFKVQAQNKPSKFKWKFSGKSQYVSK